MLVTRERGACTNPSVSFKDAHLQIEMMQVYFGGQNDCSKLEKEYKDVPCRLVFEMDITMKLRVSQHQLLYKA